MSPRWWLYGGVALILAAAVTFAWVTVSGWREASERVPVLQETVRGLEAERDAHRDAARLVAQVSESAIAAAAAARAPIVRERTVYREAVANDAECGAWARRPIACELGGVQSTDAAGSAGPGVPGDPGKPDG